MHAQCSLCQKELLEGWSGLSYESCIVLGVIGRGFTESFEKQSLSLSLLAKIVLDA